MSTPHHNTPTILSQLLDNSPQPLSEAEAEKKEAQTFHRQLRYLITTGDMRDEKSLSSYIGSHSEQLQYDKKKRNVYDFIHFNFSYSSLYKTEFQSDALLDLKTLNFCFSLFGNLIDIQKTQPQKDSTTLWIIDFLTKALEKIHRAVHRLNDDAEVTFVTFLEKPSKADFIPAENFYLSLYAIHNFFENNQIKLDSVIQNYFDQAVIQWMNFNWGSINTERQKEIIFECVKFYEHHLCHQDQGAEQFIKKLNQKLSSSQRQDYLIFEEKYNLAQHLPTELTNVKRPQHKI